jgi:hypothetical protein
MAGRAGSAAADYSHFWNCSTGSAVLCIDSHGGPNPWLDVGTSIGATRFNICAKATTDAGNTKDGSGCNVNSSVRCSRLTQATPYSNAYVYWAGTGGTLTINGRADTFYECL